jgi:hypothetical protein
MSKYPQVDKMVFDWFVDVRHPLGKRKPLPLSRGIIQARAKRVASELGFADFNAPNASEVDKISIMKSVKDFMDTANCSQLRFQCCH